MKWLKDNPEDKLGETRTVKKFLFFPLMIDLETRWLESVEIDQIFGYYPSRGYYWFNLRWTDQRHIGKESEE